MNQICVPIKGLERKSQMKRREDEKEVEENCLVSSGMRNREI